jgi:mannose-1-phosphate guanylyltransferase
VHDAPFVAHQVRWLHRLGVARVHIAAGYRAEQLETWFAAHREAFPYVSLSREPEPLGTAGAVRFAADLLPPHPALLVLNGDTLLPHLDLTAMTAAPLPPGVLVRMAVTPVDDPSRYGTVRIDPAGCIRAFLEKNAVGAGRHVNGGVYWMHRTAMEQIPAGTVRSLERDHFPAWANAGALQAVETPPPLLDMGTPEGHVAMVEFMTNQGTMT